MNEGKGNGLISSNGLQAILRISPTVIIHREVAELPAARKLQLAVVEREERLWLDKEGNLQSRAIPAKGPIKGRDDIIFPELVENTL
ncbi:MAG: hypothetical protein ACOY30_16070 [Bacillota bacterium]